MLGGGEARAAPLPGGRGGAGENERAPAAPARAARRGWRIIFFSLNMACFGRAHEAGGMTTQDWLWGADGAALALAVLAGVAESRRNRRRDLDDTGWVPWRGIQAAAFFAVLGLTILALKPRGRSARTELGDQARQLERGLQIGADALGGGGGEADRARAPGRRHRQADEQAAVEQMGWPSGARCCAGFRPARRSRSSRCRALRAAPRRHRAAAPSRPRRPPAGSIRRAGGGRRGSRAPHWRRGRGGRVSSPEIHASTRSIRRSSRVIC